MLNKNDPIGKEYYRPLRTAEILSNYLFWIAAALSLAVLQVDEIKYPALYTAIQSFFALAVLFAFLISLAIRLHWSRRAHEKRVSDLVSNIFGVALVSRLSINYYNNDEVEPFRRMAALLLENSLFSKSILNRMLQSERTKVAIYTAIWFLAMLNRATDFALLGAVAQVLFSEQIIARWIRMEWYRNCVERIYDDVYSLVQSSSNTNSKEFRAHITECLLRYETGKAHAGISLSTRAFNKLNVAISHEWDRTKQQLKI